MTKRTGAAGRRWDEEAVLITWTKDGEVSPEVMTWQAKRVLVCAARGQGYQRLWLRQVDGTIIQELRIRNAPGGCIILDSESAGTHLAADLVLAIERLGAGNKVRIERLGRGAA